jgi:hypothetical protein
VWRVVDAGELNEAVLAMASEFDHLDSIDVVVLDHADLESAGLEIIETPGRTPIIEIANKQTIAVIEFKSLLEKFVYLLPIACKPTRKITRSKNSKTK